MNDLDRGLRGSFPSDLSDYDDLPESTYGHVIDSVEVPEGEIWYVEEYNEETLKDEDADQGERAWSISQNPPDEFDRATRSDGGITTLGGSTESVDHYAYPGEHIAVHASDSHEGGEYHLTARRVA